MSNDLAVIGIHLERTLLDRVTALAKRTHRTRSAVIRIALDSLTLETLQSYTRDTEAPADDEG